MTWQIMESVGKTSGHKAKCARDKPTMDTLWQIYPGLSVPHRKVQKDKVRGARFASSTQLQGFYVLESCALGC